jgi:WD40 repeat protein
VALAYSPDGDRIASSCEEGVSIRDRATGECLREWSVPGAVSALAFAPDGSWLVSGDEAGAVRIWLVATGCECAGDERLPHALSGLAISADGTWGATAQWSEVRIWDAATGAPRRCLAHAQRFTQSVATTPNGHVICDWGHDPDGLSWESRIAVWDPATGDVQVAPQTPLGFGVSMTVDPTRQWLIGASHQGLVRVWDLRDGRLLRTLADDPRLPATAIAARGGRIAEVRHDQLGGSLDWIIHVWGDDDEKPLLTIAHDEHIHSVCFSPDGARIAGACGDGTVRVWSARDGAEISVLRCHEGVVHTAAWSEDGRWVLSGGDDGFVRVWDAATGEEADLLHVDGVPLTLVVRKDRLYVGCWNRTVCVYAWTPPPR